MSLVLSLLSLSLLLKTNRLLPLELLSGEPSSRLEGREFQGLLFDCFSWLDFSNSLNLSSSIGG